jgi:hypothetical protein
MKTLLLTTLLLSQADSVVIKDKIIYFEQEGFEYDTKGDTTRIIFTGVKPYISWQEMIELMNDKTDIKY